MKKILFFIVINLFTSSSYANLKILSCREASERYKAVAVYYDKLFQEFASIRESEKRNSFGKRIIRIHEDFKDQEYKKLYEFSKTLTDEKGLSINDAETWRMFMESSIDNAYVIAGENLKTENLGRNENYYSRRIYDLCMGFK